MAKRGGNQKKKKKTNPQGAKTPPQENAAEQKPLLPPPSRRDRPVKMVRKVEVEESTAPPSQEKNEDIASGEEQPAITIRQISPVHDENESPSPEEGVYPSRRRRANIKRVRKEEIGEELVPDLPDESAETSSRKEEVENPPPWLEQAEDGDWDELPALEPEEEESLTIQLDEHGFRIDLPEMDEDGDWESGGGSMHGDWTPQKKFWQVAEVALTDEDGDTEEEWEEAEMPEPEDDLPIAEDVESDFVAETPELPKEIEETPSSPKIIRKERHRSRESAPLAPPEGPDTDSPSPKTKTPKKRIQHPVAEVESPVQAPTPRRRRRRWPWILLILLGILCGGGFAAYKFFPEWFQAEASGPQPNCLGIQLELRKGLELHKMNCSSGVMVEGESLESLLIANKVDWKQPLQLIQKLSSTGISLPGKGTKYTLLHDKKDPLHPVLFSYEPSPREIVVLTLQGPAEVYRYQRPIVARDYHADGAILTKSFAETMYNRQSGLDLTQMVYDAMKWKLDLFELKEGDQFKMVYGESQVEGGNLVIDGLEAIQFLTEGGSFTAFHYRDDLVEGFFDDEGRPVKSPFLMMPLRYGRISSPYSLVRPDPFSENGEIRPHLGTDYAAPEGTEILAVADGFVEESTFSPNNGNYVKLTHQGNIQTQYLHMRNIADSITPGQFVSQGTVIGYVGMTGRATGPHVCFRYWKNGVQVDHRREKFLPSMPLSGERAAHFFAKRDSMVALWDQLDLLSGL